MGGGSTRDWSERDFDAIGVGRPRTRAQRRRRRSILGLLLGSAATVALLTVYAPRPDAPAIRPPSLAEPPELRAPPARWTALAEPALTPFTNDPATSILARRHEAFAGSDGAAFRDVVEIGRFSADATHLRIAVERGLQASSARSLYVEIALQAAQAGLAVERAVHEEPLATRRGPVEIARVQLEDGAARECMAFRDGEDALSVRMSGWLCAGGVTRGDLACALDAFDLVDEAASRSVLPGSVEGASTECAEAVVATASGDWIEAAGPAVSASDGAPVPPRRPSSL